MNENKVEVGKYTLESLTTGMYSDPKIIYREYIQNSVDSLEEAIKQNIVSPEDAKIEIIVNEETSSIIVIDNGVGISSKNASSVLLNIGNSKKRNDTNRGFRGIGRLGGMSYCDKLIFSTSFSGEGLKTIVSFDCNKLRKLLIPGEYDNYNLNRVLEEITSIQILKERQESHYFQVELINVTEMSDLLNIAAVESYISQVAPVPFNEKKFFHINEIKREFNKYNFDIDEFNIFLGDSYESLKQIYKPNSYRFESDRIKKKEDTISGLRFVNVSLDDNLCAVGWYAESNWYGSICDPEISCVRIRKGNILIGDSKTLNSVFKEARFNSWTQGEIYVITNDLIPNARRDDFEQNDLYYKFQKVLSDTIGSDICKTAREASVRRNDATARVITEIETSVEDAKKQLETGFNSSVDKKKIVDNLLKSGEKLKNLKVRSENLFKKNELTRIVDETKNEVELSDNYKINNVKSNIDRKSKKMLIVISDILSRKLGKALVDEIIEDIIKALNK